MKIEWIALVCQSPVNMRCQGGKSGSGAQGKTVPVILSRMTALITDTLVTLQLIACKMTKSLHVVRQVWVSI